MKNFRQKGFTVLELLIVFAIIGLISSIILVSMNVVKAKARDAKRKTDLRKMQAALELYYEDFGHYPITNDQWRGTSTGLCGNNLVYGYSGPNGYIPDLAPNYINILPEDPLGIHTNCAGYIYRSNASGSEYKLLDHWMGPESWPQNGQPFYDPCRYNYAWMVCVGPNACANPCAGW